MSIQDEHGEIIIYQAEDGQSTLEVHLQDETVWLTQRQMAELFDTSSDNISLHLKNIYSSGELQRTATTEDFSAVQRQFKEKTGSGLTYCLSLDK
jgi:hypothetical protein